MDAVHPLALGTVAASPRVIPPDARPHGRTYGEWAAAWWQYVLSVPAGQNPLLDETGADCAVGQSGHVFFLAGILNVSGTAVRTECVIPTGTMLFFPIVNTVCTNEPPPLTPTDQLRPCAAGPIETATDLVVEIDGGAGRWLGAIPGAVRPLWAHAARRQLVGWAGGIMSLRPRRGGLVYRTWPPPTVST